MDVVTGDNTPADSELARSRVSTWRNMSTSSRKDFIGPEPGMPRIRGRLDEKRFNPPDPSGENPADTFALLTVYAHTVDFLDLRENQRFKFARSQDGDWEELEVNP